MADDLALVGLGLDSTQLLAGVSEAEAAFDRFAGRVAALQLQLDALGAVNTDPGGAVFAQQDLALQQLATTARTAAEALASLQTPGAGAGSAEDLERTAQALAHVDAEAAALASGALTEAEAAFNATESEARAVNAAIEDLIAPVHDLAAAEEASAAALAATHARMQALDQENAAFNQELREVVQEARAATDAFQRQEATIAEYSARMDAAAQAAARLGQASEFEQLFNATTVVDEAVRQLHLDLQQAELDFKAGRISADDYAAALETARAAAIQMSAGGSLSTKQMSAFLGVLNRTAPAAGQAGAGLGRLRQPLTSLAARFAGTNVAASQTLSTLLSFGVGTAATLGITAGIAGIGLLIDRLTRRSREAAKAFEETTKRARDFAQQRFAQLNPEAAFGGQLRLVEQQRAKEAGLLDQMLEKRRQLQQLESQGNLLAAEGLVLVNARIEEQTQRMGDLNAQWRMLNDQLKEGVRQSLVGQAELEARTVGMSPSGRRLEEGRLAGLDEGQLQRLKEALQTVQAFQNAEAIRALNVEIEALGKTEAEAARLALSLERHLSPSLRQAKLEAIAAREAFQAQQAVQAIEQAIMLSRMGAEQAELYRLKLLRLPETFEAEARGAIRARFALERHVEAERESARMAADRRRAVDQYFDVLREQAGMVEDQVKATYLLTDAELKEAEALKAAARERRRWNDLLGGTDSQAWRDLLNPQQKSARELDQVQAWRDAWKDAIEETSLAVVDFWTLATGETTNAVERMAEDILRIVRQLSNQLLTTELSRLLGSLGAAILPAPTFPGFNPGTDLPAPLPAGNVAAGSSLRAGAGETHYHIQQTYEIRALDARGVDQILREHAPTIARINLQAVKESQAYRTALFGRR